MREVIFDTETTGLIPSDDRVVEIGCVEIENYLPTGRTFHVYINPQREIPKEVVKIHGLTYDFLKTKPTFKRIVRKFLDFIGDSQLVAHNASFDINMINAELDRLEMPRLTNPVVDSLQLARTVKPGGKHTLDVLLRYFGIDGSKRDLHGALLDSQLLSEVYIELRGGRQMSWDLAVEGGDETVYHLPQRPNPLPARLTEEEIARHRAFIETLPPDALWRTILGMEQEQVAA